MARMLKCPRCKEQSAYKTQGRKTYPDNTHQHYTQKLCPCGYEGQKKYGGRNTEEDCFICRFWRERHEAEEKELGLSS